VKLNNLCANKWAEHMKLPVYRGEQLYVPFTYNNHFYNKFDEDIMLILVNLDAMIFIFFDELSNFHNNGIVLNGMKIYIDDNYGLYQFKLLFVAEDATLPTDDIDIPADMINIKKYNTNTKINMSLLQQYERYMLYKLFISNTNDINNNIFANTLKYMIWRTMYVIDENFDDEQLDQNQLVINFDKQYREAAKSNPPDIPTMENFAYDNIAVKDTEGKYVLINGDILKEKTVDFLKRYKHIKDDINNFLN